MFFPGLDSHPGHDLAKRQMRRYGGMVSFRVAGGEQAALDVCARTKVITLGESLGGVESLIEHPGKMTHASVAGTPLEVPPDLVRLSVGIEDVEDLIADLERHRARLKRVQRAQSTGSPPARTRSSLARLNGREPKKPERADSGDGCALAR